jgi:hypothetical protein
MAFVYLFTNMIDTLLLPWLEGGQEFKRSRKVVWLTKKFVLFSFILLFCFATFKGKLHLSEQFSHIACFVNSKSSK